MEHVEQYRVDCDQILGAVYLYLDLECDEERRKVIKGHLDECSPCLREYGIEHEVKALVARCCGNDRAPDDLRARLRTKIDTLVTEGVVMEAPQTLPTSFLESFRH